MRRLFADWWNRLALGNGKAKFRTAREAEEFIENLAKNSGGPNAKIIAMRKEYEAIKKARDPETADRSSACEAATL